MKHLKIFIPVVLFSLLFLSAFATSVKAAYQIGYMYVQHRIYEDGRSLNRLYFEMYDEDGNYIPNGNVVKSAQLSDPNDNVVNLKALSFDSDFDYMGGWYDCGFSKWNFDEVLLINGYYDEILDPLIPGTYRLEVTADDGQTYQRTYEFNQQIILPTIVSSSFKIHPDKDGNVYWTWDIPDELCRMSENYQIQAKAIVSINANQKFEAYFQISLPAHMGLLFIPNKIVQQIVSSGDEYSFLIQLRTPDNNNRSYTKSLTISDMLAPYPKDARQLIEAFVTRFYQLCLDRNPDPAGLEGWTNDLLSQIRTGADVAKGFIFSPEFIGKGTVNADYLTILYKAFFSRDPDQAGWAIWLSELNAGRDRGEVLDGFIYSTEFSNLCSEYGIKAF